jgi:uncharacterized protein YjbI with pentapeptide repeats
MSSQHSELALRRGPGDQAGRGLFHWFVQSNRTVADKLQALLSQHADGQPVEVMAARVLALAQLQGSGLGEAQLSYVARMATLPQRLTSLAGGASAADVSALRKLANEHAARLALDQALQPSVGSGEPVTDISKHIVSSNTGPVLALAGHDLRHVPNLVEQINAVQDRVNAVRFDMRGADLSGMDLKGIQLSRADLTGADFRSANLADARLIHSVLQKADLRGANLKDAYLNRADLTGTQLQDAGLIGANLQYAELIDANLQDADLTAAKLPYADLTRASMRGAVLSKANLYQARLIDTELVDATLEETNLTDAIVAGANLSQANLTGAHLVAAYLYRTDLSNANLTRADVRAAQFNGAKVTGKELAGVSLEGRQALVLSDDRAQSRLLLLAELLSRYNVPAKARTENMVELILAEIDSMRLQELETYRRTGAPPADGQEIRFAEAEIKFLERSASLDDYLSYIYQHPERFLPIAQRTIYR